MSSDYYDDDYDDDDDYEVHYCTECGATLAEDECFDGGICEDCHEQEVEEHERDMRGLNQPIIPQRFVY